MLPTLSYYYLHNQTWNSYRTKMWKRILTQPKPDLSPLRKRPSLNERKICREEWQKRKSRFITKVQINQEESIGNLPAFAKERRRLKFEWYVHEIYRISLKKCCILFRLGERTAHFPSVNFVSFSQNADFPHNWNFSTPFSLSLYSWPSRTRCTVFLSSSLSMRSWRRSRPWWGTKASASWWRPLTQSSSGSSRSSSKDSESHL